MKDERTPYETGLCCMSQHANATPPWTCKCPCHSTPVAESEQEDEVEFEREMCKKYPVTGE